MTFKIDVRVESKAFQRSLTTLEKREFPFAAAGALNMTAFDVRQHTIRRMGLVFDRPTSFTQKGISYHKATKQNLVAAVGFGLPRRNLKRQITGLDFEDESTHAYLLPQEYGGKRPAKRFEKRLRAIGAMRNDEFAVPARYNGIKLDRYGNVPASVVVKVLSQLLAFNDAGYDANETERSRKRAGAKRARYFVFGSRVNKKGELPRGIYEVSSTNKLKAVFIFVKQPVYKAVLGFRDGAEKTTRARLPINFRAAMDRAIKTSRLA